jgi:ABC-type uncharacterized transport system substrate-binding protein
MANDLKNIFISHIHEDDDGLKELKTVAQKNGLDVRDSSITSEKPNKAKSDDYIKQMLADHINWASTLVVYVSPDTKDSKWVNWEIEYAAKAGKRIVGVWEHGANECEVPEALENYADAMVGWHGENIVDAIIGKANDWYNPQGQRRDYRPIKRYKC